MFQILRNAWKITDLRKKILFTVMILLIFRIGFEGGQMPLVRRIPKRGFNNVFAKPLTAINLTVLNRFEDGAVVNTEALLNAGIINKAPYGVKILGNGKIEKSLTVQVAAFSESAKAKIEAAGGKAEVI